MNPGEQNTYTDKFDAVWRRVMSENAGQNAQLENTPMKTDGNDVIETDRLRKFMDDEVCDARLYELVASKVSVRTRQTLLKIAADERRHLKKLRAKYFILTGKTYTPPDSCPYTRYVPETLRQKVKGEAEGAKAYRAAADETGHPGLAETYRQLAADETYHALLLGNIIEDMF